jgi:hypothetical protein
MLSQQMEVDTYGFMYYTTYSLLAQTYTRIKKKEDFLYFD